MARLTKRKIDTSVSASDKEIRLWDDDPRGLGVRIKPSGAKTFFVQFRSPVTDKKVRHSIGQYGSLTLEEARTEAKKVLGAVAKNRDPAREKRLARHQARTNAKTMAEFCNLYLRDAKAGLVTYRGRPKKSSTLSIDEGRVNRHIIPLLGDMLVGDVTSYDVERFMHSVRLGETAVTVKTGPRGIARVRGGEGTARRTVGLLGSIFSYAVKRRIRDDNPVSGLEKGQDKKRSRILAPDEYRRLGQALVDLETMGANRTALRAARVLALTGCRRDEIYRLKRSELDTHSRCLRLGDTKIGQQVRPVGTAALAELTAAAEESETQYVFPAARGDGQLRDTKVFRRAIEEAGLEGVALHTLRHSFASVALELEYSEMTVAGLLGHRSHSVTSRYTHHVDRALVAAADRVSRLIAQRMDCENSHAVEIIELPSIRA